MRLSRALTTTCLGRATRRCLDWRIPRARHAWTLERYEESDDMTTMTQHAAGMFCWSELATNDPEGAKKFYRSLFEWAVEDTPISDGETYTLLKKNGREVS